MKKWSYLFICIALLSNSCSNKTGKAGMDLFTLLETDKILKYPVNENTKYLFPALFPYTDDKGKEYLTFHSFGTNDILFYDLKSGEYLFQLSLDHEGPNAVGRMTGYYIKDFNNIYITSTQLGLTKVDTTGKINRFIKYEETDKGHFVVPSFVSGSYIYTPLVVQENLVFITQIPNHITTVYETPVCIMIDTLSGKQFSLPFQFPSDVTHEEYLQSIRGLYFSRDFNGKKFVYSFELDENLYVTSIDHEKIEKINAKSKYINKVKPEKRSGDMQSLYTRLLEAPFYGNTLYDKYRDVYYRFAYPGVDINRYSNYSLQDLYMSGLPKFSVIILDRNFNIIGESLFPENTYNPQVAFIHKDGLYVSNIHMLNPNFNEDLLSFQCFELVKK
jgi:hypothetical protein